MGDSRDANRYSFSPRGVGLPAPAHASGVSPLTPWYTRTRSRVGQPRECGAGYNRVSPVPDGGPVSGRNPAGGPRICQRCAGNATSRCP